MQISGNCMHTTPLKVAVVSDLHFQPAETVKDGNKSSWLTFKSNKEPSNNFWESLIDTIKAEKIEADLLICPGDITTYSNKEGLEYAWEKIVELAQLMKCDVLATATGNHDVQSRPSVISNPIRELNTVNDLSENLKNLNPEYPLVNFSNRDKELAHDRRIHYFGTDYLIFDENPLYRLVIFNSCARHTTEASDHDRGHISESTLKWLEKSLKTIYDPKNKKVGLFVCHHHPIQHDDHELGSYDFIKGGAQLIEMLSNYGSWLVIHGHKHHAKISYHSVGSKKSVVFAAGTLSSHKDTLGENFANQFYVVDIEAEHVKGTVKGKLNVWSWLGNKWGKSKTVKDGLFTGVGFGDIGCLEELAENISHKITGIDKETWISVVNQFPVLEYCVPKDFQLLQNYLREYEIDIVSNAEGEFEFLERARSII